MLHFIGHTIDVVMKSSGGSFEAKHIQAQDSALVRQL